MRRSSTKPLFANVRPGRGSIVCQKDTKKERASKKREFQEAKRLLAEYGGDFIILAESRVQRVSTPDIKRDNREYVELKCPTSLTALDSRLKDGIMQLRAERTGISPDKPKVLILNLGKNLRDISENKIREIVGKRISLTSNVQITAIIVRAGSRKIVITL